MGFAPDTAQMTGVELDPITATIETNQVNYEIGSKSGLIGLSFRSLMV